MSRTLTQSVKKSGYAKVRLYYVAPQATSSLNGSFAALIGERLGDTHKESTVILIPAYKAFSLLASYQDAFESLKDAKAIPPKARLVDFLILPLDDRTLAHVVAP